MAFRVQAVLFTLKPRHIKGRATWDMPTPSRDISHQGLWEISYPAMRGYGRDAYVNEPQKQYKVGVWQKLQGLE